MNEDDAIGELGSLVRRVQEAKMRRDERDSAYAEIVRRFQDAAFGWAYVVCGDYQQAEDIAQEAFMEAWHQIEHLRDPDAFPGWFRQIAQTRCHRYLRRKRLPVVPIEEADAVRSIEPDAHSELEARESRLLVRRAIRALPTDERIPVVLFHLGEYSYQQIAAFLGISETAVDNRLRAGRRRLKGRMLAMVGKDLQAQRPSRNTRFVEEAMRRPPELTADEWAILMAANDGDVDSVRRMLDDDPNLLTATYAYWQPLHFGARAGRTAVVKLLLERGADPLAAIGWHSFPLASDFARDRGHAETAALLEAALSAKGHVEDERSMEICDAVRSADFDRIDALLREKPELVNVSERVQKGDALSQQPLHIAVEMDRPYLVGFLLDRGANIEGTRGDGLKPIHLALWNGRGRGCRDRWSMVQYLLDRGAEVSLSVAAARNDFDSVRRMLDEDPSRVNESDCGCRPISCAAERHRAEMVKFLLERGADPNLPEDGAPEGYALYVVTCVKEHVEIARMLLEAGADTQARREASGDVSLAIVTSKNLELVNLLYEYGAVAGMRWAAQAGRLDLASEILAANPSLAQDYLYGYAIQQGHLAMVKLMVKHGARLDPQKVVRWQTALAQSLVHRRMELAEFLMERGEDINWHNWFGQTPLHYLVMRNRPDMVEWALDHGADIEARDWELESRPLAWAAHMGHKEIVELLLRRGAKVRHPEDQPWNTPIARAEKKGHVDIAETLRQAK